MELHHILLVANVEEFAKKLRFTSQADCLLPIGITQEEWKALWFDVLRVDLRQYEAWAEKSVFEDIGSFPIPNHPMIARITNLYMDTAFEGEEIEQLKRECVMLRSTTDNPVALQAIDKLLDISNQAQNHGLDIYFLSD